MPDRSAGVQQGREWTIWVCPECRAVNGPCDWSYHNSGCSKPRQQEEVRVVEAVSPEPREGEQEMTPERRERLLRELAERSVDPDGGLDRDLLTGPPPDHTIASVLRLTASRLRDPEYRWSVDPAVTLEHLAERVEAELAEARRYGPHGEPLKGVIVSTNAVMSCDRYFELTQAEERLAEKLEKGRDDGRLSG